MVRLIVTFLLIPILFLPSLAWAQQQKPESSPPLFWWGVANAAFQVEGEPADSDWQRWTQNPKNIADGQNANQATGFWQHPEKDFDLAHELGANMFRLSIAWERVEPKADQWDEKALDRYAAIIMELKRRKIEPMVTLQHFVLPTWLVEKGGLAAPDFADYFSKYAVKVVQKLSIGPTQVKWWATFNEPMVLVAAGYVTGEWPPNRKNIFAALTAEANLIQAHLKAIRLIKADSALPKDLKFTVAAHLRDFQAKNFGGDFLNAKVTQFANWVFNWHFLDGIATTLDYLAINYYGRNVIHLNFSLSFLAIDEGEGVKTDLGWVIYPEGLGHILKASYDRYHVPILISENGIADANDSKRVQFLRDHIEQIRRARTTLPVIGYLHWSLTDNFEWASGFGPRFGLVEFNNSTGERKPRPSFWEYKKLINEGMPIF